MFQPVRLSSHDVMNHLQKKKGENLVAMKLLNILENTTLISRLIKYNPRSEYSGLSP